MVRSLRPVLTGDLPFQLLELPAFLEDASAELREREDGL